MAFLYNALLLWYGVCNLLNFSKKSLLQSRISFLLVRSIVNSFRTAMNHYSKAGVRFSILA